MKDYLKRIEVNHKVMVGKPVIKGTRVTVEAIIERVKNGLTFEEILQDFPNIKKNDIKAALEYAESLVKGEQLIPAIR